MRPGLPVFLLAAALAGCSTIASRIKAHRAEFDAYAPEVQAAIREGRADVGFTPEQAEMALGRPQRRYARKTASAEQEVWAYADSSVGVGLGVGMSGGSALYGAGIDSSPSRYEDRVRLVFEGGKVVAVESRKK